MSEADHTVLQPVGQIGACSPTLLVRQKKKIVACVALDKFVTTLGRAPDCDIVLDDSDAVSRTHAQILVLDGEVVIEDLNSRNGVRVNRRPVKRHTLRPGDRVAIGEYRLQVLFDQGDRIDRVDRPPSERDTVELMRLWKGAAVAAQHNRCPLCHASEPENASPGVSMPDAPPEKSGAPATDPTARSISPELRTRLRRRLMGRRKSPAKA